MHDESNNSTTSNRPACRRRGTSLSGADTVPISSADVRRVCGPAESSLRCKLGIRLWLNLSSSPAGCGPRARPGREAGPRLSPPPAWAQPAGACRAVPCCDAGPLAHRLLFSFALGSCRLITLPDASLPAAPSSKQNWIRREGKGREGKGRGPAGERSGNMFSGQSRPGYQCNFSSPTVLVYRVKPVVYKFKMINKYVATCKVLYLGWE
jgi:hypothetical protein